MMLAQQKGSRLRSSVMVESGRLGEKHFVDQIGSITPVEVTDRHGDSPQIDTPHERRLLTVRDFEFGDIIDDPDLVRTLDSPQNKYVQAYSMGFGRQMDQTIIDNGLGASFSGKDGTVSNSLGVANIVVTNALNLNTAKLTAAKRILDEFELPAEGRHVAVNASMLESLLGETGQSVSNQDFNIVRALVRGEVNTWLGFTFHRLELLPTITGTEKRAMAWHEDWIKLGVGIEPKADIDPNRSDKRFNAYIYYSMTIGAVRLEEKGVVGIDCDVDAAAQA